MLGAAIAELSIRAFVHACSNLLVLYETIIVDKKHTQRRLRLSWKEKYIPWYRIAEEVFTGSIPSLNEAEITKFVSDNNWLIIPVGTEKDRKDAITRSDPNIYFSLSDDGRMRVGFFCNTLESVRRIRNLLHGFHTAEKENFIQELRKLDGKFKTGIQRKIKEYHHFQAPEYETVFEFPTNMIDENLLTEAFEKIDRIMEESDALMKGEGKSWRTLAPVIRIAHKAVDRNERKFSEVLRQLKPAYQIALHVKTDQEIEKEIQRREKKKIEERQRKFREFVKSLKEKGVGGKEYREAIARWNKENRSTD